MLLKIEFTNANACVLTNILKCDFRFLQNRQAQIGGEV